MRGAFAIGWPRMTQLTVYWRPGCGYCRRLRQALDRQGVAYEAINIWEEAEAREFVRSVADGNETVPTVRLAGQTLVNPRPDELLRLVGEKAPELVGAAPPSSRFKLWHRTG